MHSTSMIEILSSVSAMLFGFWPLIPLVALRYAIEGHGSLRKNLSLMPRDMLILWGFFLITRLVVFANPMPTWTLMLPEPLSTILFFTSGVALFIILTLVRNASRDDNVQPAQPGASRVRSASSVIEKPASIAPVCPACGVPMVVKTARQGSHAGQSFYACPNYPTCRRTAPIR